MEHEHSEISPEDREAIIRDKYNGNRDVDISDDIRRLAAGEPLAYIIGWIPFLGLRIGLSSHPLIPRPETEWWTEMLIEHLRERFKNELFTLLDLCAGSGAIGLAVLKELPNAEVYFGEIDPAHAALIEKNLEANNLDASRATIRAGDLYEPFFEQRFNIIAANPPYIPDSRELDESVTEFEPAEALFAGGGGMLVISRIASGAKKHFSEEGELWMECDVDNVEAARDAVEGGGATDPEIYNDPYGRPRLVVGYFP